MKKRLITKEKSLSLKNQLGLSKGCFYYTPKGGSKANLAMIKLMDEHILEDPTAVVLMIQDMLEEQGYKTGYERV